jgi:hypothetical protein
MTHLVPEVEYLQLSVRNVSQLQGIVGSSIDNTHQDSSGHDADFDTQSAAPHCNGKLIARPVLLSILIQPLQIILTP